MSARADKLAFLFPGQGSQRTGMLVALRGAFPRFDEHLRALDARLTAAAGRSLLALVDRPPSEAHDRELTSTDNAQPALGLVSLALARAAADGGVIADFFAGHSYGELAALAAAGALDDETFFALSVARGRLMAAAGERAPGAMLAVRAESSALAAHLAPGVVVANLNAPKQTVVSGDLAAIERTAARLDAAGLRTVRLRTACAFHSPLMEPVAADWARVLGAARVNGARAGVVVANVTGALHPASDDAVRDGLARQMTSAVEWIASIERLYALGVRTFVEVGPGRVLTDLVTQILAGRPHRAIALEHEGAAALPSLRAVATPAPVAVDAILAASERALTSVLTHHREIAQLASTASPSDRAQIATALVESSERLLQDFLATQRAALGSRSTPTSTSTSTAPADDRGTDAASLERFLRRALTDLTGFPASMIARETDFERDLALDSITMVELFCQMIDAYPALKGMGPELRTLKTVGAAVDALAGALAPAESDVRLVSENEARDVVLTCVAEATQREVPALAQDAELEQDLGLDVFARETLAASLVARMPALAVAGRELLRRRTVRELVRFVEQLTEAGALAEAPVPLVTPASSSKPSLVQRYVRRLALTSLHSARIAGPLLLVGPAGPRLRALAGAARAKGAAVATMVVSDAGFVLEGEGRAPLGDVDGLSELLRGAFAQGAAPSVLFLATPSSRRTLVSSGIDTRALELAPTALFTLAKAFVRDGAPALARLGVLCNEGALWRGAHGVARALAREWLVPVRSASLAGEVPPARVLDALLCGPTEHDLVLEGMRVSRFELALEARAAHVDDSRTRLRETDVVLFVGGGRGITAEMAVAVAARAHCRIAVVGRTPLPAAEPAAHATDDATKRARELWTTKTRIEAAGGKFFYRCADATRAGELADALSELRAEAGPFSGVVHGVGVAEDALVQNKSLASFRRVLDAKVKSAVHVRSILAGEPMRFAFFLSSLAAHSGTAGQTDYVAANEIVNALAHEWAQEGTHPVRALLFSVWTETGLASVALKRQMQRLGLDGIGNADGAAAFLSELEDARNEESWVLLTPESTLRYVDGAVAPPAELGERLRAAG